MAKAIASDVLESIISSILSLAHIKLEKNTPSTILWIITCFKLISKQSEKFLNKSWVSGLGGFISFSKATAID